MSSVRREVWIVGPGRMGIALGSELLECGWATRLLYVGRHPKPPLHPVFDRPEASYGTGLPDEARAPDLVLITTSDAGISDVVTALLLHSPVSPSGLAGTVVLHTSGGLGADALAQLDGVVSGAGSLHPLVSVADPERDAMRLRRAWYGIDGDAKALEVAADIAAALGGRTLTISSGSKAVYHAAAVFASNYLVAIMNAGERLMESAGVDRRDARAALAALASGTLSNVEDLGPEKALTGPVSRGDAETVERHLLRLSEGDRLLYSALAREALELAVARGLSPEAERRISDLLQRELP